VIVHHDRFFSENPFKDLKYNNNFLGFSCLSQFWTALLRGSATP